MVTAKDLYCSMLDDVIAEIRVMTVENLIEAKRVGKLVTALTGPDTMSDDDETPRHEARVMVD